MKKFTLTSLIILFMLSNCFAQQEKGIIGYNNWLNSWTEFKPIQVEHGQPSQILSGNISKDTKLLKKHTYLILGDVFVTNNATLSIEPGTIIIGDFETKGSLTISRGSKLIAKGTQTDPIVFTSSRSNKKQGDWGGLFILGDAPINTFGTESSLNCGLRSSSTESIGYGGQDTESDSGILKYLRIEFAGKRTKDYGYFNGLTLAGVGTKTIIENIMVTYCAGNSFNILGGSVILEKLVSFRASKNDYEFNHGTESQLINSIAIRSPYISSAEGSRCISVKSYTEKDDADSTKNTTFVNAENLTLVTLSDDLRTDIKLGLVKEAIYVGEDVSFTINKSVISGFYPAVILAEGVKLNTESLQRIQFTSTYFNNCKGNIFKEEYTNNDDLESWYGSRAYNNVYSKGPNSETFIDAENNKYPDFRLRINKIIASNDFIDFDDDDD